MKKLIALIFLLSSFVSYSQIRTTTTRSGGIEKVNYKGNKKHGEYTITEKMAR